MITLPTRASTHPAIEADEHDDSFYARRNPAIVVAPVEEAPPGLTATPNTARNKFAAVAAFVVPGLALAFAYGMSLVSGGLALILLGALILTQGVFVAVFRVVGNSLRGVFGGIATIGINAATVAAFYNLLPVLGAFLALLSIYAILAYGVKEEPCISTKP